jgi:hypothetical protein
MIHRKATLSDIPAIVEIAVASVSVNPIPVKIDRQAMADTIREGLNPAHFVWVTEINNKVVASVVAHVSPGFWHERLTCSVLLYYTLVPGAGIGLLRQFARWIKSRSAIKVALFELEPDADPRLVKFLKRLGFDRQSQNLTYVRGA